MREEGGEMEVQWKNGGSVKGLAREREAKTAVGSEGGMMERMQG